MTKSHFENNILDSDELRPKHKIAPSSSHFLPKKWEMVGLYSLLTSLVLAFMTAVLFVYSIFNPFFLRTIFDFILIGVVFFTLLMPWLHYNRLEELYDNLKSTSSRNIERIKDFIQFNYLAIGLSALRVAFSFFGIFNHLNNAYRFPNYFDIQAVTTFVVLVFFLVASLPELIYYIYSIHFFSKWMKYYKG